MTSSPPKLPSTAKTLKGTDKNANEKSINGLILPHHQHIFGENSAEQQEKEEQPPLTSSSTTAVAAESNVNGLSNDLNKNLLLSPTRGETSHSKKCVVEKKVRHFSHSKSEEEAQFDEPASPTANKLASADFIARQNVLDPVIARLNSRLSRCRELLEEKDGKVKEKSDISPPDFQEKHQQTVATDSCSSSCPCAGLLETDFTELNVDDLATFEQRGIDVQSLEETEIVAYQGENEMTRIMELITKDLSEPYSIYTYRYFIHNWPDLCFLARRKTDGCFVGAIVCKLDVSRHNLRRGYIAMLAVDNACRRQRIGSRLVRRAIETMNQKGCDEVVLETEVTNEAALRLYENLGFARDKRLFRYYLNGVDAFRLKLWLTLALPTSHYTV